MWKFPILLDAVASEMQRKVRVVCFSVACCMKVEFTPFLGHSRTLGVCCRDAAQGHAHTHTSYIATDTYTFLSLAHFLTHFLTHPSHTPQGDSMMSKWAEVMTNMKPKTYFLRPDIATTLGIAVVREFVEQKLLGKPDRYQLKA